MPFKDWVETEVSDPLILPIRGKQYVIPECGHLDAIAVADDLARVAKGEPSLHTNEETYTMLLGPAFEEMRADNVPPKAIAHAALVARIDFEAGRDMAEMVWSKGPNPQALVKAMVASADSITSPSTPPRARTSSTKKPASTRSTGSRTAKKTASRSRGKNS